MRLVFAGTPHFAEVILNGLLAANHKIVLVLTQPDRPSGRGLKAVFSPVKQLAQASGLEVFQPASLRDPGVVDRIRSLAPDLMVVAAYGLIVPAALLKIPHKGALNIHASLLPRWRGAAPIERAILAGDERTGISIMRMEEGLDTGPVLRKLDFAISGQDDAGTLHDRLASLGATLIVAVLEDLRKHDVPEIPQPEEGVTYARKIEKAESIIDWKRPAPELERAVRAYRPHPGASTLVRGMQVKVWRSHVAEDHGEPGTVLSATPLGLVVACGAGALTITELQRAGGKKMPAADFLRGLSLVPGSYLAQ